MYLYHVVICLKIVILVDSEMSFLISKEYRTVVTWNTSSHCGHNVEVGYIPKYWHGTIVCALGLHVSWLGPCVHTWSIMFANLKTMHFWRIYAQKFQTFVDELYTIYDVLWAIENVKIYRRFVSTIRMGLAMIRINEHPWSIPQIPKQQFGMAPWRKSFWGSQAIIWTRRFVISAQRGWRYIALWSSRIQMNDFVENKHIPDKFHGPPVRCLCTCRIRILQICVRVGELGTRLASFVCIQVPEPTKMLTKSHVFCLR